MIKVTRWFIGQYVDTGEYTFPCDFDWAARVLHMFCEPKRWRGCREHFGLRIGDRYISLYSHKIR